MKEPIIITGCPRSRTSMVSGILARCGVNFGEAEKLKTSHNRLGQYENVEIIKNIEKPHLQKHGYDPMGQNPLPNPLFLPLHKDRRSKVLHILNKQNMNLSTSWGIKDCKAVLSFFSWLDAFPDATWIIVHRNKEDIAKSCQAQNFMTKCKDWEAYVDEYRRKIVLLKQNASNVYEVNTDDIINYRLLKIKEIVEDLGLTWTKAAENFIAPEESHIK